MKNIHLAAACLAALCGSTLAANAGPAPAVTMPQAKAKALAARPGTITDAELEHEARGSGLRYSFDIKGGGHTYEVGVDARTGAILENKAEGPHPD